MSLYDESEKALSKLNDVISTVKDSKGKLNDSADSLKKAVNSFVKLSKPLDTFLKKELDLEKIIRVGREETQSKLSVITTEFKKVKAELGVVRAGGKEVKAEFIGLRGHLKKEIKSLGNDFENINIELADIKRVLLESQSKNSFVLKLLIILAVINAAQWLVLMKLL
jgi:uncharacterized coiled-coil DUF342 family protein